MIEQTIDLKENTLLPLVNSLIKENNCRIVKTIWKSMYNSSVVYYLEPISSSGFSVAIYVTGDTQSIEFIKYLYKSLSNKITFLENCYRNKTTPSSIKSSDEAYNFDAAFDSMIKSFDEAFDDMIKVNNESK